MPSRRFSGALKQITYPSTRVVQQWYDAIGRLCAVATSATTCSPSTYFATGFGYNTAQQVTGFNYGNGVAASFTYSSDMLQIQNLSYAKGAATLFALGYFYKQDSTNCPSAPTGNNGQIQCIKDTTGTQEAGRSVTYTYDPLSRLSTALSAGSTSYPQWGLSWGYDKYGNRLNQTWTAGNPPSNSLTFASPSGGALTNHPDGMCFDANGNLTAESGTCPPGSPTYSYDAENRLVSYMGTGGAYTYDGNSLRVKKVASGTTTVYIFSGSQVIAEYDNGALVGSPSREYIYSGNQSIATIEGSSTTFLHPDHQSVRVSTDSTGSNVRSFGNYPYGEVWYETGTASKLKFTTYERDAESTNDYAMARSYVNRFGRFLMTDPLSGDTANPQSLNRYAYVIDDPTNLSDPSGECYMSGYTGPNCNGLPPYDANFGSACTIDGVSASFSMAFHQLQNGSATLCPNGDCTGLRFTGGPGGVDILQKWIPPQFWTTNDGPGDKIFLHVTTGYWQNIGVVRDQSGDGWWTTFFQDVRNNFWQRVWTGNRNQGESFGTCVLRNADETTFGGHKAVIGAVMATASAAVSNASKVNIPNVGTVSGTANIALYVGRFVFLASGGTISGLSVIRPVANTIGFAGRAAPYVAAAEAGLLIGSAINCR